ncbi:MAG: thioredoxin domain-containing protein [Armatimonadota bacterium]
MNSSFIKQKKFPSSGELLASVFLAGSAICLALFMSGIPIGTRSPKGSESERVDIAPNFLIRRESLLLGSESASVKLVVFGDYECPPCRAEWPHVAELYAKNPNRIAVYFRHFPLRQIHPLALSAALLVEAAKKKGAFLAIHEQLYASPLTQTGMRRIGVSHQIQGLTNDERFEYMKEVVADLNAAERLGLTGTPTMFLVEQGAVFRVSSTKNVSEVLFNK